MPTGYVLLVPNPGPGRGKPNLCNLEKSLDPTPEATRSLRAAPEAETSSQTTEGSETAFWGVGSGN